MYRLLFVVTLTLAACTRVDVTEYCVLTRYGEIIQQRMGTGLQFTPISDATCFPLTDQNFPGEGSAERVEAQTRDPVTVTGDVAITYTFMESSVPTVFQEKRTPEAAQTEVLNAIREGYRNAIASWSVADIFSERRPALADSVRVQIQRKLGDHATIRQVFIRDIRIPQQIEAARIDAAKQAQVLDQARKQYTIDSVNARAQLLTANASAEARRLEAQAYATHPAVLELKKAEAIANICKGTQTCVIGGSVMDGWMGKNR